MTQQRTAGAIPQAVTVHRFGLVFTLALLLTAAALQPASAQVVRGTLVDAASDRGIGGAMLTLLDRSGRRVEQALTREDSGTFELRAPAPGEYRLRSDRIGYATTYSEYFGLGAGDTLTLGTPTAISN